jgi:biopolymer transport protein ExbD
MKKHIITIIGCLAVVFTLLGCSHTKPLAARTPIVISIAADGTLAIDGQQCAWEQLADRLRSEQYRQSAGVTIQADKKTRFSDVIAVVEACKAAGMTDRLSTHDSI